MSISSISLHAAQLSQPQVARTNEGEKALVALSYLYIMDALNTHAHRSAVEAKQAEHEKLANPNWHSWTARRSTVSDNALVTYFEHFATRTVVEMINGKKVDKHYFKETIIERMHKGNKEVTVSVSHISNCSITPYKESVKENYNLRQKLQNNLISRTSENSHAGSDFSESRFDKFLDRLSETAGNFF